LVASCALYVTEKVNQHQAGKQACKSDVQEFCGNKQSHWGIKRCLMKHFFELSVNCSTYIQNKLNSITPDACDQDVSTYCAEIKGFSAILTCLKDNRLNITDDCRRFLRKPSVNEIKAYALKHQQKHQKRRWQ